MNYNEKGFLLPESPRSMACYHAKIESDNIMKLTIHDCNRSIRLHNNLNDPLEVCEAISKLTALEIAIQQLRAHITNHFTTEL